MARPTKRENSTRLQYRKRVPLDILEQAQGVQFHVDFPPMGISPAVSVTVTVGTHLKFSLYTKDDGVAKYRASMANLQIEQFFERIRLQANSYSLDLDKLAKEIYYFYSDVCRNFPRFPNNRYVYEACMRARSQAEATGTQAQIDPTYFQILNIYPRFGDSYPMNEYQAPRREMSEKAVESRVGAITSWYLAKNNIQLKEIQRSNLLFRVDRIANGFSPHSSGTGITQVHEGTRDRRRTKGTAEAISFDYLFDRWRLEAKPSLSTINKWRKVLFMLKDFLGHDDATRVSSKDLNRWKESLLKSGNLSHATLDSSYFTAIRRFFSLAAANDVIPQDPSKSLKVSVKRNPDKTKQPYTNEEVTRILRSARNEKRALYRWLPWLCAFTGARAGEITQLWFGQIRLEADIYILDIQGSEDGGTIKNVASRRSVPLHPILIREGFLDFVKTRKDQPLFYEKRQIDPGKVHPAKVLVTRQGTWIKKLGLDHTNKSPNHAFRHWFKSVAVKAGISDGMADAIQGHARPGEAAKYRHYDMKDLYEAICKVPAPS